MKCKKCKKVLPADAKFCTGCGAPAAGKPKTNRIIIGTVLAVIVLFSAVIGILVHKKNAEDRPPQSIRYDEQDEQDEKDERDENDEKSEAPPAAQAEKPAAPDAAPAAAEKPDIPLEISVLQTEGAQFPRMTVFARITDALGQVPEDLRAELFTITETDSSGGVHNARISEVYRFRETDGISMNLVMDQSGSMSTNNNMAQARTAATAFLEQIRTYGTDSVAITSFDSYVYLRHAFTNDYSAAISAVNALMEGSRTALYDAISSALLHTNEQSGAKCVVVFTDGEENESSYTYTDVVELSRMTGIPVFIIGIGDEISEQTLRDLAGETGGAYFSVGNSDLSTVLTAIYASIYETYRSMYTICYTSSYEEEQECYRLVTISTRENSGYVGTAQSEYIPEPDINSAFGSFKEQDYILSESSTRALTIADLEGKSLAELRIARNEIFARHGRQFKDPLLNQWFYSKDWYQRLPTKYSPEEFASHVTISNLESQNATFILEYENQQMEQSSIFPNCLSTALTEYDVSLTKAVLQRGLEELYSMAGVPLGKISMLTGVAKENAALIQSAIDAS